MKHIVTAFFITISIISASAKVMTNPQPEVDYGDYQQNITVASNGDARAACVVADCYFTGIGTEKNINEAWKWYAKAAERGDLEARYRLGCLYRDGMGVKQNDAEATYWFRKAALNGHALALLNLADCYYEGRGLQGDYRIAAEDFWRASDRGVPEASYRLALMLRDGIGVNMDKSQALKYFKQAAQAQYADAEALAEELEKQGVRMPGPKKPADKPKTTNPGVKKDIKKDNSKIKKGDQDQKRKGRK